MSFDTLAPWYRTMELVAAGGIMQRCRTAFLAETRSCRRALLLGEGPGRFLRALLRANPGVEVTCVERSPRMIAEARSQLDESELARVRFERADVLSWQPLTPSPSPSDGERVAEDRVRGTREWTERSHARFDLIVTNFFLDCFRPEELQALVAKIAASATADARWLIADFREPKAGWQRWRARAVLTLLYAFFRAVTGLSATRLTPADEFLGAAGFQLSARRLANCGLVHADLWRRVES